MATSKALPEWDLSDLFKSADDPGVDRAVSGVKRRARAFDKRYRGKIARIASSPSRFKAMLVEYEQLWELAYRPLTFASLRYSEASTDQKRGAFSQRIQSAIVSATTPLVFFELELAALPQSKLKQLIKHAGLKGYSNYLKKLLRQKRHQLSEPEEKLLKDKSLTGRSAFLRLYTEERSAAKYNLTTAGKTRELSESELLKELYSPRRAVRKAAAAAMSAGLAGESRRMTFVFNTLLQDKKINDGYRKFKTPEDSRHLANETEKAVVDTLARAVSDRYSVVQRYYQFKRRALRLKKLYDYDRYAPFGSATKAVPFKTARDWILDSFESFSPDYAAIAKEFFDKSWIDAPLRPGKRGGAFCSMGTPGTHPYVFMNYTGTMRDVFTLAHELGHGVHGYLMREQTMLGCDSPLTICETASVFAEMLLFEYLKTELADKRALFGLYTQKIEDIFATAFRQISMHRFEQDVHTAGREQGELSTEAINAIWRNRQREMFGRSVELTAGYDYWWMYIPHFLNTPFYVYAYAFGELMTLSLFSLYRSGQPGFVPRFMNFMASGSTRSPAELVRPFKVNLKKQEFWDGGVGIIDQMVKEVRKLK